MGATLLGRANYAQQGLYLQSFFALSTGIERACKIAILVDYALDNNGQYPPEKAFRKYGHNLSSLVDRVRTIADKRQYHEWPLSDAAVQLAAIDILTEFASNTTRYYNLDFLVGVAGGIDELGPVARWYREVTLPLLESSVPRRRIRQVDAQAEAIGLLANAFALVRHVDERGEAIGTLGHASQQSGRNRLVKPWERLTVLQVVRFLASVLDGLGTDAYRQQLPDVPYLNEFFARFVQPDGYLRTRKTWSMYRA